MWLAAWLAGAGLLVAVTRPYTAAAPAPFPAGRVLWGFLPGTHTAMVGPDEDFRFYELWDIDTGRQTARHDLPAGGRPGALADRFLPIQFEGRPDGLVLDATTDAVVYRAPEGAFELEVAGDRAALGTAQDDEPTNVFELPDWRLVRSFPGSPVAFDGRHLTTIIRTQGDKRRVFWDVDTGAERFAVPEDHRGGERSADGRFVLLNSYDRHPCEVRDLWAGTTRRLGRHAVWSATFTSNGWVVANADPDGGEYGALCWADPAEPETWVDRPGATRLPASAIHPLVRKARGGRFATLDYTAWAESPVQDWLDRRGWWPAADEAWTECRLTDLVTGRVCLTAICHRGESFDVKVSTDDGRSLVTDCGHGMTVWTARPRAWGWLVAGLTGWTAGLLALRRRLGPAVAPPPGPTHPGSPPMSRKPVRDDAEAGRSPPDDDGAGVTERLINRDTSTDPLSRQVPAVGDPSNTAGVSSEAGDTSAPTDPTG